MDVVQSVNGVPIRLTDERWDHIIDGHDDLRDLKAEILETIVAPVLVLAGEDGELIAMRRHERRGWIVVPYREVSDADGFIITAFTSKAGPSPSRDVIWP